MYTLNTLMHSTIFVYIFIIQITFFSIFHLDTLLVFGLNLFLSSVLQNT